MTNISSESSLTNEKYTFHLLKGRLYVNGLPFSGLPSTITNNSDYKECF